MPIQKGPAVGFKESYMIKPLKLLSLYEGIGMIR